MGGHPSALHPGRAGVGRAVHSAHAAPPLTQHATSDWLPVLAQLRCGARGGKLAMAGALGRVHGEVCGAALAFPGGAPAVLPGVMERVSADE